ncbi:MAG: hypothetical protein R3345_08905 [Fulvivirga sp.]|nr:hypothetical protein [Fulvivirga sp.]
MKLVVYFVQPNEPLVYKTPVINPPKIIFKSWHNVNKIDDPYTEITQNSDSFDVRVIDDDTLGYIFTPSPDYHTN